MNKWLLLILSTVIITFVILRIPKIWNDIHDTALLEGNQLATTRGVVVMHSEAQAKYICNSSAVVSYRVSDREYGVQVEGCGALKENLPIGSMVDVEFVIKVPSVSKVVIKDAETKRSGWFALVGILSIALVIVFLSLNAFVKDRKFRKNAL